LLVCYYEEVVCDGQHFKNTSTPKPDDKKYIHTIKKEKQRRKRGEKRSERSERREQREEMREDANIYLI
jgi:hypothetical protein